MADEAQERSEPATPRRKREAWKRGQVAYSRKVSPLLHHCLFVLFFAALVQAAAWALADFSRRAFSLQMESPERMLFEAAGVFVRVSWPFWVLGVAGALLAGWVQTGLVPNFLRLRPRWENLSPSRGLGKIWSRRALTDALVALPFVLFLALGGMLLLWMVRGDVLVLQADPQLPRFAELFRRLLWMQFGVLFLLSAMDVGIVLWRHARELRMTRREIQEEHRQQEGDPHVRMQRRSFFERLLAMPPEHRLVSQAKVVIVNPEHVAVAVGMDESREPFVLARTRGEAARKFKRLARRAGVPVVQDPRLARALCEIDEQEPIPSELLEALAVIFVALGLDADA